MAQIIDEEQGNFEQLRDCLSTVLVEHLQQPKSPPNARTKRRTRKCKPQPATLEEILGEDGQSGQDVSELADFTDYIASETFSSLRSELRLLTHRTWTDNAALQDHYALPLSPDQVSDIISSLDPSIADSLLTYGIVSPLGLSVDDLFARALSSYIDSATKPPPNPALTRGQVTACELCGRNWIVLTYHHLIPRMVHAKVVKRGWHENDKSILNAVAWLCRACHSFVHKFATHEDLVRNFYTVDLLLEQEPVKSFAAWVSRLRWKGAKTRVKAGRVIGQSFM